MDPSGSSSERREAPEEEELRRLQRVHGDKVIEYLQKGLSEWTATPLNIAVTGSSGQGKSTLINTLRGIKPNEPGAAKTGVTETTMKPEPYSFPLSEKVKVWDLPGVGTGNFPKETYLEKINFKYYDFYIVVSATRFTENDAWLAKEVLKCRKQFYFVRSKVDVDIRSDEEDNSDTHTKDGVLKRIRESSVEELKKLGVVNPRVFLVSKNPRDFDFGEFFKTTCNDLPVRQREALILSNTNKCNEAIKEKTATLKSRAWKVAIVSAAGGLIPVSVLSRHIDTALIMKELGYYQESYGLTADDLKRACDTLKVPSDTLVNAIRSNFWFDISHEQVLKEISKISPGDVVSTSWIVMFVKSVSSYSNTRSILEKSIESMEEAALEVENIKSSIQRSQATKNSV